MPNGQGTLYKNSVTGETVMWKGSKPPTMEDLEYASAQQKYNEAVRKQARTAGEKSVPSLGSESMDQVRVNAPEDIKGGLSGLGSTFADPFIQAGQYAKDIIGDP